VASTAIPSDASVRHNSLTLCTPNPHECSVKEKGRTDGASNGTYLAAYVFLRALSLRPRNASPGIFILRK
jgi:hypothetical protein